MSTSSRFSAFSAPFLPLALIAASAAHALAAPTAGTIPGDSCADAQNLVGVWSFAFDNSSAATGPGGQTATCPATSPGIANDLWYWWPAPSSGLVRVSTCDGPILDTKIHVYAGLDCGTSPVACGTDVCGPKDAAEFYAEAGELFLFQIGSQPGTPTGQAQVTITIQSPNSCSSPVNVMGEGVFPFDNTNASHASFGQFQALCNQGGTTEVHHDVWYSWLSYHTGTATLSTCGLTSVDTKVAVYAAPQPGCPTSSALACNDDDCGAQSRLSFAAVEGQRYLVQIGVSPGNSGGSGAFRVDVDTSDCAHDDGSAENSYGRPSGGATGWLQSFGTPGQTTVLSSLSLAFGAAVDPAGAPANGTPCTIAVWDDPNDDGDPSDAVLLRTQTSAVDQAGTDLFNHVNLVPPVTVRGAYFVGVGLEHGPGVRPIAVDLSGFVTGRSWFVGGNSGIDFANLMANPTPPTDIRNLVGTSRAVLLRAGCAPATGSYEYCHSGNVDFACGANGPGCASGLPGRGCANSANPHGAMLSAVGSSHVFSDSVRLLAAGLPPNVSVLFFQATTGGIGPSPFGDGMRCVGGQTVRLGTKNASIAGNASFGYGLAGDPPVHERGLVSAPGWRYYQAWYRNAANFCSPATFNLTNGMALYWQ